MLSDFTDCSSQLARLYDMQQKCVWPEIYDETIQDAESKATLLVEVCRQIKDEKK